MDRACCEFKVFETDKGFRILASGDLEELKTGVSDCCDCCQISVGKTEGGLEITIDGDKSIIRNKLKGLFSKGCCD